MRSSIRKLPNIVVASKNDRRWPLGRVRERRRRYLLRPRRSDRHEGAKCRRARGQAPRFRIGINVGDVIIEDDDIFGDGVNVAARLEGIAEPAGIAISANVYELVRNRVKAGFRDLGELSLKNIARPCTPLR